VTGRRFAAAVVPTSASCRWSDAEGAQCTDWEGVIDARSTSAMCQVHTSGVLLPRASEANSHGNDGYGRIVCVSSDP
jgi:hypothetical protein